MPHTDDSRRTPLTEQSTDSETDDRTGTPPDVSGGWRAEYAAQGAPASAARPDDPDAPGPDRADHRARADGGAWLPDAGALVLDREDANTPNGRAPEQLVVLDASRSLRAREVLVPTLDEVTVAEVNPGYPGDAPVATAVYVAEAAEAGVDVEDPDALDEAAANGVVYPYAFPTPRLRPAPDAAADDAGVSAAW